MECTQGLGLANLTFGDCNTKLSWQLAGAIQEGFVPQVREVVEMERIAWQERIVITPDLHHGEPCIKGTRIPVAMIVGSMADGMTMAQIRDAYPQLTDEDIRAALAYAADLTHEEILIPLRAWG